MNARPTVTEVAKNFPEYLDRVARGERFVLMQGARLVAELTPIVESRRLRELPALLASLSHLSPDDLDAFEADLAGARKDLDHKQIRDP